MKARIVAPHDVTGRDIAAWEECAASAIEPNPFLEPGWLLPALAHLPESPGAVLVFAEHAGTVHACVPLFQATLERTAAATDPAFADGLDGARGAVLNTRAAHTAVPVGTPLVSADRGSDALACIVGEIGRVGRERRSKLVVLEWLVAGGPAEELLAEVTGSMGVRLTAFESWERGFLRRADGGDEYWLRAIGKHRRRTIGQHRRNLEAALGTEATPQIAADGSALEAFLRLEMAGWKGHGPGGLALGRDPGRAAFFRGSCQALMDRGRLVFVSLGGPDGPVAMICCVRAGPGLFAYRTAYDERFARHGPGVQVFLAAMAYFDRSTDAAWLDTCAAPGNEHLLALFPDRRRLSTMVARINGAPSGARAGRGGPARGPG